MSAHMQRRMFACTFCVGICILFFPMMTIKNYSSAQVWAEGKAECVMELHSRRILYESKGDTRLPMASTTKILTAITVLEHCPNITEVIKIPLQAVGVEGSSVYLKEGDSYTVEDLLYGLMLRSGNDCATALGIHVGGDLERFTTLMNQTAERAGALSSHFANPHGLPCDNHYTTARDLSLIACYAMHNTKFAEIVGTKYYAPRHWKNKNKMLSEFEGGIGIKTGYTKQAGRCLVTAAKRGNMTLICTVLNCSPMFERSAQLLEDAFKGYSYKPILTKGTKLSSEEMEGYVREDFYYPMSEGEEECIEIKILPKLKKNEEICGEFQIYLSKRLLFSGNLYKIE